MLTRILAVLLTLSLVASAQRKPITLATLPSLSPDGKTLVFEYRGDIWKADSTGGEATRITSHPAFDSFPQISPDGMTLYFNSNRQGSDQVFKMPLTGGTPTQLTFHSEATQLNSISPDESFLIVSGRRDQSGGRNPRRLIKINLQTPAPEEILFNDYGDWAQISPDGKQMLFTQDGEPLYRKGYRGSRASKIYLYTFDTAKIKRIVKKETESRSPLWMPDGSGFYYSDASSGIANISSHTFKSGKENTITSYTEDATILPAISRDGSLIVYRCGINFHTVKPGSKPKSISLWHDQDLPDVTTETIKIDETKDADFSPSGNEIVFSAEGELWAMDTILKEPVRLTETSKWEDNVLFTQDARTLLYISDDGVNSNIYEAKRSESSHYWWQKPELTHTALTNTKGTKSQLKLSPQKDKIAWVEGNGALWVSLADGSEAKLLRDGWGSPYYSWSHDGHWLTFSSPNENFNSDIFIIPADGSAPAVNISRHPDDEYSPSFSPDGTHIAFVGLRHGEELDIYYVPLTKEESEVTERDRKREEAVEKMKKDDLYKESPSSKKEVNTDKSPKSNTSENPAITKIAEFLNSLNTEKKNSEEQNDAPDNNQKNESSGFKIDFEDIHERIRRIDIDIRPTALTWSHDSKSLLFQNDEKLYSIELKPDAKPKKITNNSGDIIRIEKDNNIYWISGNKPAFLKNKENSSYEFNSSIERTRENYQRLGIRIIWRIMRDQFYDPALNNKDWPAILKKYEDHAAAAPDSRSFSRVANMLLGELNASHMGFRTNNTWPKAYMPVNAKDLTLLHLGAKYDRDHAGEGLLISSIIPNSPADREKSKLQEGDIILSINGAPITFNTPLHTVLTGRLTDTIEIVFKRSNEELTTTLQPISYSRARSLARKADLATYANHVHEISDQDIGYIHVAAMAWKEFEEFEKDIFQEGYGRDGLIIDVRDNGGGFTADHLLTVLTPPRFTYTIPRGGDVGYPHGRRVYATWHKPIVVLCNQHSYSNAEIFTHAIKKLGRGKVIGVPTAGGVISTGSRQILDLGRLRRPFRGWFLNSNGEDLELYPAVPDIIIWNDVGKTEPKDDRQLLKAVEVLKKDIKTFKTNPVKPAKYRSQTK